MSPETLNRFWLLITLLLIVLILVGGLILWNHRDNGEPINISFTQPAELKGEISLEGAVTNPGSYPFNPGDNLDSIIRRSGGVKDDADLSRIQIVIPQKNENFEPQKVDINRADVWLLQALPGIGEIRAQAIIDYRDKNGLFRSIDEISDVPGIGEAVFQNIRPFITVINN
jgi:competence protein ComEA